MSEDKNNLPNAVFRDQVWRRFEGSKEPATVEDVANLYRAMLALQDHLLMITDVTLNHKRLNFAELNEMKDRGMEMVEIVARGLTMLDERVPADE